MRSTTPALLLAFVLVFTACGGDDESDSTTPTTTTGAGSDAGATVLIDGFEFAEVADAAVGEEVVVLNQDATSHTWTSTDGSFDSGTIAGGGTFTFTFDTAGEYSFFCSIHPSMTGSITIPG